MGYSYGGFMAMWANTQTNRFKAIVAGGGLSDWMSYYGTNGIDQWMIPYFGKSLYEDPAHLLEGVGDPHDPERAHAGASSMRASSMSKCRRPSRSNIGTRCRR